VIAKNGIKDGIVQRRKKYLSSSVKSTEGDSSFGGVIHGCPALVGNINKVANSVAAIVLGTGVLFNPYHEGIVLKPLTQFV